MRRTISESHEAAEGRPYHLGLDEVSRQSPARRNSLKSASNPLSNPARPREGGGSSKEREGGGRGHTAVLIEPVLSDPKTMRQRLIEIPPHRDSLSLFYFSARRTPVTRNGNFPTLFGVSLKQKMKTERENVCVSVWEKKQVCAHIATTLTGHLLCVS